jgi:hypothetical protein
MYWLTERLYSEECLMRRRRPFFENLWQQHDSAFLEQAQEVALAV